MSAAWLFAAFLAGGVSYAVLWGLVRGASDLTAPAERQERLAGTLWEVASDRERELAEEKDRADALAAATWLLLCGRADPAQARRALEAHQAARAAEVAR